MLSRTAKSCGPDAPTLASSFAEACRPNRVRTFLNPRDDGGKRARSPGRARHKPLKPLRRECRVFRGTCGDYRVLTTIAHGLRVHRAPGFPCALCSLERQIRSKPRAHRAAGTRIRAQAYKIPDRIPYAVCAARYGTIATGFAYLTPGLQRRNSS